MAESPTKSQRLKLFAHLGVNSSDELVRREWEKHKSEIARANNRGNQKYEASDPSIVFSCVKHIQTRDQCNVSNALKKLQQEGPRIKPLTNEQKEAEVQEIGAHAIFDAVGRGKLIKINDPIQGARRKKLLKAAHERICFTNYGATHNGGAARTVSFPQLKRLYEAGRRQEINSEIAQAKYQLQQWSASNKCPWCGENGCDRHDQQCKVHLLRKFFIEPDDVQMIDDMEAYLSSKTFKRTVTQYIDNISMYFVGLEGDEQPDF